MRTFAGETLLATGDYPETMQAAAESYGAPGSRPHVLNTDAGLAAVGSSGLGAVKRRLTGSVSGLIVHHARRPVKAGR